MFSNVCRGCRNGPLVWICLIFCINCKKVSCCQRNSVFCFASHSACFNVNDWSFFSQWTFFRFSYIAPRFFQAQEIIILQYYMEVFLEHRGLFRTQWKIYDGSFLRTSFAKNFPRRFSTGFKICLCIKYLFHPVIFRKRS